MNFSCTIGITTPSPYFYRRCIFLQIRCISRLLVYSKRGGISYDTSDVFRAYRIAGAFACQPACRAAVHLSGLPHAKRTARYQQRAADDLSSLRTAFSRFPNRQPDFPRCECAERAIHGGVGLRRGIDRRRSLLGDTGGFHHAFAPREDYASAVCVVGSVCAASVADIGQQHLLQRRECRDWHEHTPRTPITGRR